MRDPYAVLGVAKSASEKDIKTAFRNLAKRYHPDANIDDPSAGEKFNEANHAYEILGDKDKRAQFDRGEIGADGKPKFQGFPGGSPFGSGGGGGRRPGGFDFKSGGAEDLGADSIFSDFFDQAFSRGGARAGAGGGFSSARNASLKGEDIPATLKVRLEDIVSDEKVEAVFPSGKRLAIRLPDGVEDKQTIRLRGQGQPAPLAGGKPGDALVTIEILAHPRFTISGRDLTLELAVPLETAILGGKVAVETLDGYVSLNIPVWTNGGRTLRLKGKGLTRADGRRGDILASVRIVLPEERDDELVALFRQRAAQAEGSG